ncbi:hypothetical protein [Streptomyces iakyrus]|uniref:hypothetical protein n=1 Tax=Streptomyces iakyrus TaxID=68219 RepID=UPI0037032F99
MIGVAPGWGVAMFLGSRSGFGLEFHVEHDPQLLCVDIFVGGLHVNTWDNAFYPPLLEEARGRAQPLLDADCAADGLRLSARGVSPCRGLDV